MRKYAKQRRTDPERHAAQSIKLCMEMRSVSVSLIRNLLHVMFIAPRILRWLVHFVKLVVLWCNEHVNANVNDKSKN